MDTKIDKIFYQQLGEKLNLRRQMIGYSYRYLSKLTGISAKQLDDYMLGKYRISNDAYKRICEALHLRAKISLDINLGF